MSREDDERGMKIGLIVLALTIVAVSYGFTDACNHSPSTENHFREWLKEQGFTRVRLGDSACWGACDHGGYGRYFTARTKEDAAVQGTVCCGFFGLCAVKFN